MTQETNKYIESLVSSIVAPAETGDVTRIDDGTVYVVNTNFRNELKQALHQAQKQERERTKLAYNFVKECLDYCEQQNGRPDCKNCGLDEEVLEILRVK